MEESLETYQALDPIGYLSKFTSSNTRPSSRSHHTIRKTTLLPTVLTRNTHGSSLTTIGKTQIITGISLQIGTPSPSQKSFGEMDVSLNFSPLCGGKFTTGGRIQSGEGDSSGTLSAVSYSDPQSLESWIKRTIVNADLFDLSQLCIREGHSAWKVNINCMVINHDGNIVDACILGIMMALKDLRLPAVTIVSENSLDVVQILQSEDNVENRKGTKLKLSKIACSATIAMFQGKLLVDPTLEEEIVSDGMITVVVDLVSISEDADTKALNGKMISLSKSGGGAIVSGEEIAACVQLAFGRAKELQSILLLD